MLRRYFFFFFFVYAFYILELLIYIDVTGKIHKSLVCIVYKHLHKCLILQKVLLEDIKYLYGNLMLIGTSRLIARSIILISERDTVRFI